MRDFARGMEDLLGGVFMTGFAVTAAQPSGLFGMLREGLASRRALAEASQSAAPRVISLWRGATEPTTRRRQRSSAPA